MADELPESRYARFWRCALQVNPSGYSMSYRGKGHGYSPEEYNLELLQRCLDLDIKVVGFADHGSIDELDALREVLEPAGIVVFPGFEIMSTEKVHLVCLYPERTSAEVLRHYLGGLGVDVRDPAAPSEFSCRQIASKIQEQGGFCYAAHGTNNNGILKLQKDGGGLPHIWQECDLIRAVQIPGKIDELPDKYRKIVKNQDPAYRREQPVVAINARDISSPDDLEHPSATTWVKMTEPTFEAFKVAFLDPESRIRLNHELEESPHAVIERIQIHGGYLDGVDVLFSRHLNTLIGGRGTGKSTLVECLRFALDLPPKGKEAGRAHHEIIKENLGRETGSVEVTIHSHTQGRRYTISRRYGEPPRVLDEDGTASRFEPADLLPGLEIYGQNEIHEVSRPEARAQLLERLLPVSEGARERRDSILRSLAENRRQLVQLTGSLDEAEEKIRELPKLEEQLKSFRELGVEEKLAKSPLFARERQLVERVKEEFRRVRTALSTLEEALPDLVFLSEETIAKLPHASALRLMRTHLEEFGAAVTQRLEEQKEVLSNARGKLNASHRVWEEALAASETELDRVLKSLPDMAGKSGREIGTEYRRLTKKIEEIRPLEAKGGTLKQLRDALVQERRQLIAELSELRAHRANELSQAIKKLNRRLRGKLKITLLPERDRSALLSFLLDSALDGVGQKRLAWVEEHADLSPCSLAEAILAGEDVLRERFDLTPRVAEALTKLSRDRIYTIEELELDDHIEIELNVGDPKAPNYKALERLSTGQQATAILHLLLLDNPDPLIVDQPEDNLDNAFIAKHIVEELRRMKTSRQFIFATHNANIPVFGDAEWIGVVTAVDQSGAIYPQNQGSIDVPDLRDQVAVILEGGRAAFIQRKEKYDF